MKKPIILIALLFLLLQSGQAQYVSGPMNYMGQNRGVLMGGLGVAVIDNQTFVSINFRPEFALGKFGVGLNLSFLYDTNNGHIRSQDWDSGYDYLRLVRYLRYGRKYDPIYARIGTLDAERLGHGFIVNYYTNEASYDNRKIGMTFDLDMGQFGFESLVSNIGRAELIGLRGYYRPLLGVIDVPIIKNFAIGATVATDLDPDVYRKTEDATSIIGFDLELPVVKTSFFRTLLYYDWAQIKGYSSLLNRSKTFGTGQAVGVMVNIGNLGNFMDFYAKLERRWLGEEFMGSFFDPFYEIQRYQRSGALGRHKVDLLVNSPETKGVFGELYGSLLDNKVRLLGMLGRLDDQPKSGTLHLEADASEALPVVAFHAAYDKIGVETVSDVFTLNNQSVARVGIGYKMTPYLILYADYIWTFVEQPLGSHNYKPQERIEPRLVFMYHF